MVYRMVMGILLQNIVVVTVCILLGMWVEFYQILY